MIDMEVIDMESIDIRQLPIVDPGCSTIDMERINIRWLPIVDPRGDWWSTWRGLTWANQHGKDWHNCWWGGINNQHGEDWHEVITFLRQSPIVGVNQIAINFFLQAWDLCSPTISVRSRGLPLVLKDFGLWYVMVEVTTKLKEKRL